MFLLVAIILSISLPIILSNSAVIGLSERYEGLEDYIDVKLLPGVRIGLFTDNHVSPDTTTHIWHGFNTGPRLWSEMTEYEKTEFLATAKFRFFFKGEEIPLKHILRYDDEDGYGYSIFYEVFPPGFFPKGNHQIRGEWAFMINGIWDTFGVDGVLRVNEGGADLDMDTDGDGLSDGEERMYWGTDHQNLDTDGDGLSDGEEVLTYGTDPTNPDSDDDGLTD